jgi:hypothetical protein
MNNDLLERRKQELQCELLVNEVRCELLESALTVVIGDEIIKPELVESGIGAEGHYNLRYRRKDKNKRSCGFAVSLETFYGRCNDLEKNVYIVKNEAKRLMLEGELENDE